ncbi:NAD(P)-dependent malic enzyme [Vulcanisaeta distributa]|uniref:Malate dehydrogenase (Oxaloacetate-decarboxylating) n=1 Tax=Vulcanisaeta distributa (strain DSM 14429 / JCM 11212 / NBRC 100878 / IC-017) TaxID=572478 RepID=E1QPM6_VULDI|nr:NADP-dependent malic enzyme [Vulcanisaeta distributa]ADN50322.1 Malate dehydrogenase (oxaloacetate-decarboxylating) [Vulcanisaeta distributa DSM 14429]
MSEESSKWFKIAIEASRRYGGKIMVLPKVPVRSLQDFSIWYTPGVAAVSKEINANIDKSFEYTWRWNAIAVLTDGSRVLGLGNVGPEAAMPVMEGKSLLFKYLGGVDAVPLPIRVKTQEDIVNVAKAIEPAFGGINLEDIESPKCFYVLDKLREELKIAVWHDDQQGTAGAILAGLINAFKVVGKKLENSTIALIGAGASNIAAARILIKYGVKPGNIILVDSKGILHPEREDMDKLMLTNPWKYELAIKTNAERRKGGIKEALVGVDAVIAASVQGPGVIKKEWIRAMNKDPIIFALANPIPEIWPWEAKEAGAKVVATGRSDFPNQVNNSLVFPGVFRGALDARVRTITDEMVIAAAQEIANFVGDQLSENKILPTMEEWDFYPRVAAAVAVKAAEQGVARRSLTWKDEYNMAKEIIANARLMIETLYGKGLIRDLLSDLV